MTKDIERLKRALRKETLPVPRPRAKKRAIAHAMDAFADFHSGVVQGSGVLDRLRDTAMAVFEKLIGRRSMKLTPALAGGASLGVFLVAAIGAQYIQTSFKDANRQTGRPPLPAASPPVKTGADGDAKSTGAPREEIARKAAQTGPAVQKQEQRSVERKTALSRGVAVVPQGGVAARHPGPPAPSALHAPAPMMAPAHPGGYQRFSRSVAPVLRDRPARGDYRDQGRDRFESVSPNPVKVASEEPVSTFSIDVDTASYSFMRSSLNNNVLPPGDAVRIEELINYFPYDYARPADRTVPFTANVSIMPAPWNAKTKLLHIGIAGYDVQPAEKPRANLVFLVDTSGSMQAPNKLPLVINSMKLLLASLEPDDTVSIVTYAGSAGTALEPTMVRDRGKILQALNALHARGSTAGAEGIRQAYELARQNYDKKGVNRVILATDGDFNVGITNRDELKSYIERQRDSGIFLSVLGFGRGNYNDALMQTLAQNGNGNAAYIDTLNEARKVLVEEAGSTLFTIANDVKLQVEFNPRRVAEYRLIGYETRLLNREDFRNDKIDAGDIGAGHTVTAIYEITPNDPAVRLVDDLRYGAAERATGTGSSSDEYAFVKIRYKLPGQPASKLITAPVDKSVERSSTSASGNETRFAASVAAFGQLLKGGRYTGSYGYDDVIALAQGAKGKDPFGYRAEFINLVRLAKSAAALEPLHRR